MKSWLTKFRISSAIDERKPLPPTFARAVAQSAELRRFVENMAVLDEALKTARPTPVASASLHAGILRAIQSAEAADTDGWEQFQSRLIPASALGLVILIGVFGVVRPYRSLETVSLAPGSPTVAVVSTALETGGEIVRTVPSITVSPLSDELARLNRDVTNAQNYLLASLP